MKTRVEYGRQLDCHANGCTIPCSDNGEVFPWPEDQLGAPDFSKDIVNKHKFRWVRRLITSGNWTGADQNRDRSDTICPLCFPNMRYVANVTDGLVLGFDDGHYCLLIEPCHNGDVLITFTDAPTPDPVPDDDDEADAAFDADPGLGLASDQWLSRAEMEMKQVVGEWLRGVWHLVEDLRHVGYDPEENGEAEFWLYNRIGLLVDADT